MEPIKNTIIIPDIHGRTFWKEAIPYVEVGTPCIFLGDHADPFEDEDISGLDALKNLREILAIAQRYKDRVTMLLGNHDLSYLGDPWGLWTVYADRFCYEWADVISELINENVDLLSLCTYREVDGKPFLFSHAGMHPEWVEWCGLFDDVDKGDARALAAKVDELFGESLRSDVRTGFMDALAMVGSYRGGNAFAGSMVWADIREYDNVERDYTGLRSYDTEESDRRSMG